ncbi:DUF3800 domain-containing protein [Spirillospora sp. NPDC050679]
MEDRPPTGGSGVTLYYVDDSGSVSTGFITYSWIEVDAAEAAALKSAWLAHRARLYLRWEIPASTELHAAELIGGRGRPSLDPAVNRSKAIRRDVMESALDMIGKCPGLRTGTVYRRTAALGGSYNRRSLDLYGDLMVHLDGRLRASGGYGVVYVDGKAPGRHRAVFRSLGSRIDRIVEEPGFVEAHESQQLQMVDLVAWSAYQSLLRHQGKRFCWDWYDAHLRGRDVNDGPLEL